MKQAVVLQRAPHSHHTGKEAKKLYLRKGLLVGSGFLLVVNKTEK